MDRSYPCYLLQAILVTLSVLTVVVSQPQTNYGIVRVNPETMRLIDQFGREVYFHGVNVVYKVPPYVPWTHTFNPIHSFTEEDMKILSELGLNVIRLGIIWAGAEPTQGQYNETYYNTLRYIIETAYKYNIYTFLDMHQDVLSELFCGEGVPNWVVNTGDAQPFPSPLNSSVFGSNFTAEHCNDYLWSEYYFTQSVSHAFQNIYDNTSGVLDSFAQFWKKTASEFKNLTSVIGYELMNEPWLGDLCTDPALADPKVADRNNLQPMYEVLNSAIREVDQEHVIMFEPVTLANLGSGFTEVPGGEEYQNRSVFAYHYYSPPNLFPPELQLEQRMSNLKNLKCGGFLTEFYICQQNTSALNLVLDACDKYKQSWAGWMYKLFGNITGDCSALWYPDGTFNQPRANLLSRTYPQVVAGEVEKISCNHDNFAFNLRYKTRLSIVNTITQIYLNAKTHYADRPNVTVTSSQGLDVSFTRDGNFLWIIHTPAEGQYIEVNIRNSSFRAMITFSCFLLYLFCSFFLSFI